MFKPQNTLKLISYIFTPIGMLFLGLAVYFSYLNFNTLATSQQVDGKVINLVGSDTKKSVIEYTFDSQTYTITSSVSSNPPAHSIGDTVSVLLDVSEPGDGKLNSFLDLWLVVLIFTLLGSVFFAVGGGMLLNTHLTNQKNVWLKQNGTRIETEFRSVERNTSLSVNGTNPFRVVSQFRDQSTNTIKIFKSENLWFDPTKYVSDKTISVLVDPTNYQRYFMDLSFLPTVE